jgi:cellulose synthase/poly-beta-1,6-N-acetylglucosamine synthase-like glycosyltransferase
MTPAALVFWGSLVLFAYPFAIYPLLVLVGGAIVRRTWARADGTPSVSLIVTARNEEAGLAAKLDNCLALDYPRGKLEILVASDASTDGTDAIARAYADRGVILARLETRGGKSLAQNAALARATGEVIVHTDATILLDPGALRALVRPLADPRVGCVTSQDRSLSAGPATGVETAGLYTRYEIAVRNAEARLTSLIGVSGSFYAVRRELRPPLPAEIIDDFAVPLAVIRAGKWVVPEPTAWNDVRRSKDLSQEYRRKVRTFLTGMRALFHHAEMLNPLRHGLTSFQLLSHKLARWLWPFLLVAIFATSAALWPAGPVYALALMAQSALYAAALAGWMHLRAGRTPPRPVRAAYYFALVNVAILHAWWKLARGESTAIWEPTRR